MAWEVYPDNRGEVLAKLESTYGTDPTASSANILYVEELTARYRRDTIERSGPSPYFHGRKPVKGRAYVEWACKMEATIKSMTASLNASELPPEHVMLRCSGWQMDEDSSGGNHIRTFFLVPGNHSSAWLEVYDFAEDSTNSNKLIIAGARANWGIEWTAGERWIYSFEGAGIPQSTLANTYAGGSATASVNASGTTYPSDDPIVALGGTGKLIDLSDNSVYGAGTLGSLSNNVSIYSFSANGNFEVKRAPGQHASGAVSRVGLIPRGPVKVSMLVEQTNLDDWSPVGKEGQAMEFNFTFQNSSDSTRTVQVVGYGYITDFTPGVDGDSGLKTWSIDMDVAWAEDPTDNDPAVGVDPSQSIIAGTNQGLTQNSSNTHPAGAILAIQYRDAA